MNQYVAPLSDMRFALRELADIDAIARLPGCEEFTPDVADAVLEEAAKLASGVLSPLNTVGDRVGARFSNGHVSMPTGFREAYRHFVEGGWNALSCSEQHGGQNVPRIVSAFVEEMWRGANMAFGGCAALTRGAIEAIELSGSEDLKRLYLPKMVRGEWTGTMNLTEPQAGSDLSAIRTRAERQPDGQYRVFGQKIFISWGDHDLSENIVHLVLARTPDGPPGIRGISMFLVPKYLPNVDGNLGERNDVQCVSIEHKLGLAGSPTTVLVYGSGGVAGARGGAEPGAIGYLVGKENRGIEYMFIMMNQARFSVALEGVGLSERAYQRAAAYARERVQGAEVTANRAHTNAVTRVPIIRHPDVRRMLLWMKSHTEAGRALVCVVAAAMDKARCHPDATSRASAQAFVDLMTPVVKGWTTECAVDVASHGIQIHGGMGFIEETGAAQHWRESRIMPIYEGTTAIQANDLVGRKIARDQGKAIRALLAQMRQTENDLDLVDTADHPALARSLRAAIDALSAAVDFIVAEYDNDPRRVLVGAVPFLKLFGITAGAWQMSRAAIAAQRLLSGGAGDSRFLRAKVRTARFFADHVLPQSAGLAHTMIFGASSALDIDEDFL